MNRSRKSLSVQLIGSFLVTSIIPIVIINLFSYWNILDIVNGNNNDLMKYNLSRTETALDISIESYEDVLYQIYSNDDVIGLMNRINQEEELVVSKNQLRRMLRGYFYVKDYIKNPKPNGYKSYHMVVSVPIFLSDHRRDMKVEVQIRSVAMDFWASLEHKIAYKFEGDAPEALLRELRACADIVDILDDKMYSLHEALLAITEKRNSPANRP